MSWIGSLVGMVVGGKKAIREGAIAAQFKVAANMTMPFVSKAGGDLKRWGEEDWNRYKETYRPVAEALVDDANRAPDYNRYGREVAVASARGEQGANDAMMRSGANPASGSFAAGARDVASNAGRMRGIGASQANLAAEKEATGKKLRVLNMGRSNPSASIAGLGTVVKGGSEFGKYAGDFAQRAAAGWGMAAKGAGKAIGGYKKGSNTLDPDADKDGLYGTPPQDEMSSDNYGTQGYDDGGYADGGVIRGPGTGRSDSIPAVIDGQRPARVSNGEIHIKSDVAARIGLQRLNELISIVPR